METPFQPEIILDDVSPDVKSYIYQILNEFSMYSTPETVATVVAKDPRELWKKRKEFGPEFPKNKSELEKMYRIEITLSEAGGIVSAEGLHSDMYEAIRAAKDKLLAMLDEIQNNVMSNQDRQQQIQQVLAAGNFVH